ncbi:hypothetical protein Hanom_Chr15g01339351 [Helianthus anomalus]
MSPRVRTRHGEVTAELAWSGSGSRSEITPAVGRTVPPPPPPPDINGSLVIIGCIVLFGSTCRYWSVSRDHNIKYFHSCITLYHQKIPAA